GQAGQADAVKLGFARALLKSDEEQRRTLREHGLLTVDARVKERKKPGQRGARRKFQFTKR
ncbi:30S ribosomal protein S9, partial [bacterium]|nr:30S ribosomal protein S9 [bacterium]